MALSITTLLPSIIFVSVFSMASRPIFISFRPSTQPAATSPSWEEQTTSSVKPRLLSTKGSTDGLLRHGVNKPPVPNAASSDTIRAMPLPMFFDYLGVRLNGDRATGKSIEFTLELTDTHEKYVVGVENSAIHYSALSIPA